MHSELIEWRIAKASRTGYHEFHSEGAQSVFGLTRARKIVKALGAGWDIVHVSTLEPPPKEND